jgi:hypothetical protein
VIASNSDGSSAATSGASAKISAASNAPANSSEPTVSGTTTVGSTLTANPGTWSGAGPIGFQYQWLICDGSGAACHDISSATGQAYQLKNGDAGNTLRVRVVASNSDGSSSATSSPTATVAAAAPQPAPTGCPKAVSGQQAVSVADVGAPARLQVDHFQLTSGPITMNTNSFSVRFHVSDTCGQSVSGAIVYATAVPFDQATIPDEVATDGTGWVTLSFNRLAGFPASRKQRLMVMFVRARKQGDPVLAGISTRRLISLRVNLRG